MGTREGATTASAGQTIFDPELIIGVVAPTGSGTGDVTQRLRDSFRKDCLYDVELIRLSDHFGGDPP